MSLLTDFLKMFAPEDAEVVAKTIARIDEQDKWNDVFSTKLIELLDSGKSVHLLRGRHQRDQAGYPHLQPEPGGGRIMHAPDTRAPFSERVRRGRSQSLPLRNVQHTRPVLMGSHEGEGKGDGTGKGPDWHGCGKGSTAQAAQEDRTQPDQAGRSRRGRDRRHVWAAMALGNMGYEVDLVEKEDSLGGLLNDLNWCCRLTNPHPGW